MTIKVVEYESKHREDIRRICFETGFAGRSLENIVDNKNLFLDLATHYFLDSGRGITLVAVSDEKTAGYIFGALDKQSHDRFQKSYYAKRIAKEILRLHRFSKKDLIYYWSFIRSFIKEEFKYPKMPEYPSILHVNIDPKYHRKGIGRLLVNELIGFLRKNNSKGVQLITTSLNSNALAFFYSLGFEKLYSRPTTFFNYYGFYNVENMVLGKKIMPD